MTPERLLVGDLPGPGRRAEPRLLALRVHGFKSFAERTNVEFGPGISAVVGPNGSGKSNLADALRWALGEQGRALRSRKAEDVIWAGSEKRPAQGMADVSLVIDNADGLLPVEYQVLELGRRLYRSGENDYLLNKTRIRLRDLVDLLDSAHLADNAFLFIGQGMVDQALALRPEERRPLFDEVAGVRRHERRRRRAEEQLTESEANLARVEDILGELRPQARRLAAQAEQQATRETTADELAAALLSAMHARWFEAAGRVAATTQARERVQAGVGHAMAELGVAESAAAALAHELSARVAVERERGDALEAAQAGVNTARLRDARLASEFQALDRERGRLIEERSGAEAELAAAGRTLAAPTPSRDLDLEAALDEAERALAGALEELAALRGAQQAHGQELAALRRAASARQAEADTARRRLADADRRLAEETEQVTSVAARRSELEASLGAARASLVAAQETERVVAARREAARERATRADAARASADDWVVSAGAALASVRGRLDALEARLAEEESRGIARAARRLGGRRLDEDLVVDPAFRQAAEAALAEATRAYVVGIEAVPTLARERGSLVVAERAAVAASSDDVRERRFRERLAAAGGGTLDASVRRDANGAARRLLARSAWLPDLAGCLAIQPSLPPGWVAVPRDGSAVVTDLGVTLGATESVLERRAEVVRLTGSSETLESDLARRRDAAAAAGTEASAASADVEAARTEEGRAGAARRAAEEAERLSARQLDTVAREAAWHEAQVERLTTDLDRARVAMTSLEPETPQLEAPAPMSMGADPAVGAPDGAGLAAWEARAVELRARRDRLAEEVADRDATRRDAEHRRARAEASLAMAEERLGRAEQELAAVVDRERTLAEERDALRDEIAASAARETAAREALAAVRTADAADRGRLDPAERDTSAARERLRMADDRLRAADHADLEARLGLDALREGVIVELAGLGELALGHLAAAAGTEVAGRPQVHGGATPLEPAAVQAAHAGSDEAAVSDEAGVSDEVAALEAALGLVAAIWASQPPAEPPPSPARLGQLRRRFHEFGAVNPYAVDEYAALKARLETLETQAADLHTAIARTRDLISELDTMIGDRFQATFRALETAFATRFEQLFGGGFARLSLTDPAAIGSSGIEIVARPPGKKAQALAMLSGGERALTAVALLFAMLEVRPVPFCVLDEVDAALDEANIGRFAEALRSLAHQTQFIVITHNRGTIEAADALYGVTSGDDSVSRVISLRLDEAQAMAAVDRPELVPAGQL
ncbi:MAG: chromosome segregation protein SMC [Candidatus Limnocylindrales bacterium]|nr:chromosome segregation protein SMC [Candidatus Limnocylindrales bacterium]